MIWLALHVETATLGIIGMEINDNVLSVLSLDVLTVLQPISVQHAQVVKFSHLIEANARIKLQVAQTSLQPIP